MKKTFLGLLFGVPIPFKTYQNTWYVMALGRYLLNFCVSKVLVLQKKFALSSRINLHIIKYRLIYQCMEIYLHDYGQTFWLPQTSAELYSLIEDRQTISFLLNFVVLHIFSQRLCCRFLKIVYFREYILTVIFSFELWII